MCPKLWLPVLRHYVMPTGKLHNLMYVNLLFTSSANGIAFYGILHRQVCAEITVHIRTIISRRHSLKGFAYLFETRCVCSGSDRSPSSCLLVQGVFIYAASSHRQQRLTARTDTRDSACCALQEVEDLTEAEWDLTDVLLLYYRSNPTSRNSSSAVLFPKKY